MVTIMMKDTIYLSKLMYEAMEILTEEQLQNLLNKRGRIKITYEDIEQQTTAPPIVEIEIVEMEKMEEPKQEITTEDKLKTEPKQPVTKPKQASKNISKSTAVDTFDASAIINKLNTFKSEDEAEEYLLGLKLKKPQLQALLDFCKLSVPKSTNMKDMIKHLVDFEVGTILRSKAVRDKK